MDIRGHNWTGKQDAATGQDKEETLCEGTGSCHHTEDTRERREKTLYKGIGSYHCTEEDALMGEPQGFHSRDKKRRILGRGSGKLPQTRMSLVRQSLRIYLDGGVASCLWTRKSREPVCRAYRCDFFCILPLYEAGQDQSAHSLLQVDRQLLIDHALGQQINIIDKPLISHVYFG